MTILLPESVRTAIAQHLLSCYPREGCGALIGERVSSSTLMIHEAAPIPNRADTSVRDRFELDPLAYSKLEQRLSAAGSKHSIVGFFHSHPDSAAQPSHIDLEAARGLFDATRHFYVYLIQSIQAGKAGDLSAWRLNTLLSAFDWIEVTR